LPIDGGSPRVTALPATATGASDATGGIFTCYVLVATAGGAALGNTDVLCAIPGAGSFLAAGPSAAQSSAARPMARERPEAAVARLRARAEAAGAGGRGRDGAAGRDQIERLRQAVRAAIRQAAPAPAPPRPAPPPTPRPRPTPVPRGG
jgi:hypothetical protein